MIISCHSRDLLAEALAQVEGGNPKNQNQMCHAELVSASLCHYKQILKRVQDDFMLRGDPLTSAFSLHQDLGATGRGGDKIEIVKSLYPN